MDAERRRRVEQVLDAALTRDQAEWPAVLDEHCAGDTALRLVVEELLGHVVTSWPLLDSPPAMLAGALAEVAHRAAADLAGRRIGAWRIVREIGRGGMARVFLAERADGQFTQQVAIKLLRPGLDSEIDLDRFRAERQILASLNHPNIARLLDGGVTEEELPYLVLEYVDGQPIDRYCDERALSIPERVRLFLTVAEATQYAHQNLVVHRDLKPSNILVAADGTVKLLDFGLAKLLEPAAGPASPPMTHPGHRWMTPQYAAPEQIRGEPVTTLTDVYQLGVVLYELLTGTLPFGKAETLHELEQAVLHRDPPAPSSRTPALQGDPDAIVLKALQKEPEQRYPSAQDLAEDLGNYLSGHPVRARRWTARYRAARFVRRHRGGVALGALAVALLAGGVLREAALRARAEASARRAEASARRAEAVERYLVGVFDVADPYAPPDGRTGELTVRAMLDRGADRLDSLASQPDVEAELRTVLGRVYTNLGAYDRAVPALRRALEQRRALHGPSHPDVAEAMDQLGIVLLKQDHLAEAEPLLREALAQRRRLLGERDSATTASMDHLAQLLENRNAFAEAEPLFREALAIRRIVHGDSDLTVATSENNLARFLHTRGSDSDAVVLFGRALAIRQRTLGADHPLTAESLHDLATAEEGLGRYADAERHYREALGIQRTRLGSVHRSVTMGLNDLGQMLFKLSRLEEADSLLREALALNRRIFGENHEGVSANLSNLALVVRERGDFDRAERLLRDALAIDRQLYGAEHVNVGFDLNELGVVLRLKGQPDSAVPILREALAMSRHLAGDDQRSTLAVMISLARALRETGGLAEAESLFRRALGKLDPSNAEERSLVIPGQIGLGRTLTATGRAAAALPLLDSAAALSRTQLGPQHWRTAEAELALGECLLGLRQRARAEPLLRRAGVVLREHRRAQPRTRGGDRLGAAGVVSCRDWRIAGSRAAKS